MKLMAMERRWLVALFAAIYPSGAEPSLARGAADVDLEPFVEDLFAHAPRVTMLGIRALTWAVVWIFPMLFLGRPRRFVGLAPADRLRLIEKLGHSDVYALREIPALYKMLGGLGYCALPEIQVAVGIPNQGEFPAWSRRRGA